MILKYWTRYIARYPKVLLYMLQDTEYHFGRYATWFNRTSDFRTVIKRRQLDMTKKVKLLLLALYIVDVIIVLVVIAGIYLFVTTNMIWWLIGAIVLLVLKPTILAYGLLIPLVVGVIVIQKPRERAIITNARKILSKHSAKRVAIVGSYGKTTAKEILLAVLSEGKKVAATPGNMNTAIGISRFATKLDGDEEVLIFELGEEKVGDVRYLSELSHPEYAIMTGINEAHLESFKTLDRTVGTIFEIAEFVEQSKLYVNDESELVHENTQTGDLVFSREGMGDWKVTDAATSVQGTTFTLTNKDVVIHAETALIGLHTVGVTVAGIVMALELGITPSQVEAGLKKVKPFEHRMQPRLMHGAWVIDDTYNGNSDGVRVGLELLKDSDAKRRVYVTPGLVEQGDKTESVHIAIGEQAAGGADVVVLMKNSVTEFIKTGLTNKQFTGELIEIENPLEFYTHLDQFVAAGDVVLMQNDWTDNYK